MKCIYYLGEMSPNIESNSFVNISTNIVIVPLTYLNETFGSLNIAKGLTNECQLLITYTFSNSNRFSNSNTFSQPKTLSNSNTFTKSFLINSSLTFVSTLTYLYSITQTIPLYNTQISSFTFSYINSSHTFLFSSDFQTNENKNVIIISVCVVVVGIIIISLLVILLVRIKHKKHLSGKREKESIEPNNVEIQNTFQNTFKTNMDEDPFADDFKEEKFINQI